MSLKSCGKSGALLRIYLMFMNVNGIIFSLFPMIFSSTEKESYWVDKGQCLSHGSEEKDRWSRNFSVKVRRFVK